MIHGNPRRQWIPPPDGSPVPPRPQFDAEPYDPGSVLWESPRGRGHRIKLARKTYQGQVFFDLRVEFRREDGTWCPTRKGVSIRVGDLADLAAALSRAAVGDR
jgi:hypothetical protein